MLIPCSRLAIVTFLTKRLPVLLVPKQRLVSPVRPDVIDHGCRSYCSRPFTLGAKRGVCQESLSRPLPAMVVASFKRAAPVAGVKRSMKLAILTAGQIRAAGMLARMIGLHWHKSQPPLLEEKPSKSLLQGFSAFS